MTLSRRKFLRLAAGVAAAAGIRTHGVGASYPTRPITMVVPYAAGGPGDTVGRVLPSG